MRKRTSQNTTHARLGDRYQSCGRYNIGCNTLRQRAEQCGAVIKFGRAVRYDWDRLDADLERLRGE